MGIESLEWRPSPLKLEQVQAGDMPGDKLLITEQHVELASAIYRKIRPDIQADIENEDPKIVLSIYGGSGVGKSETGALLAHFFKQDGLPCYLLSGDNYALRSPKTNDEERLRCYRYAGLQALVKQPKFQDTWMAELAKIWGPMGDMLELPASEAGSWLAIYQRAGRAALNEYLGTEREIDFAYLNQLIADFKSASSELVLKRMGRDFESIYYEKINSKGLAVLIIEWTYGASPKLKGVQYPIYLYSSPAETLEHRRQRARDANTSSPLIELVLALEQHKLILQKNSAKLIFNKQNKLMQASDIQD